MQLRLGGLELDMYQQAARQFAVYKDPMYAILGLSEEVGEFTGKIAKAIRKGCEPDEEALKKELGDALWMLANIATDRGWSLGEIAAMNLDKLADRAERGVLVGEGDNR